MKNYNININQNESSSQKKNNEEKNISNDQISSIKIEYKKHLEILIRLLIYQNEKKGKINNSFESLNEQKKESVFLINSDWIEKFKSHFESQYIYSYLNELNEKYKSNINSNSDDKILEEVIDYIPQSYFNTLKEKKEKNGKFNKKVDNIYEENFKVKIDKNELDIKYLCNFQIINQKIFGLLMAIVGDLDLNKCELYQIGNEKLLLKFPNGICDEIGIINNKNIFIPEYILYSKSKKEMDVLTLNTFFKKNFNNISEKKDKPLPITDIDKSLIRYCLSIEYITQLKMKQEINENTNSINIANDEDENIVNSHTSETNGHNNINNQNNTNQNKYIRVDSYKEKNKIRNNNGVEKQLKKNLRINKSVRMTKEQEDKNIGDTYSKKFLKQRGGENKKNINNSMNIDKINISDDLNNEEDEKMKNIITPIIEIILLMKKFEIEIDTKINESSSRVKNNIKQCILLKKEWIDKFNQIYINKEIESYLNSNKISDDNIVDIEYIYSNYIKNKKDYIKNINANKLQFSSNDLIKFNTKVLTQLNKNTDIYYPKDFYIINQNIYGKLIKLYKSGNSDEIIKETNMINYIINNEKTNGEYNYFDTQILVRAVAPEYAKASGLNFVPNVLTQIFKICPCTFCFHEGFFHSSGTVRIL